MLVGAGIDEDLVRKAHGYSQLKNTVSLRVAWTSAGWKIWLALAVVFAPTWIQISVADTESAAVNYSKKQDDGSSEKTQHPVARTKKDK